MNKNVIRIFLVYFFLSFLIGYLDFDKRVEPFEKSTERLARKPKEYDLDLHLTPDGPTAGIIRVVQGSADWSVRTSQRFFLLHLLGQAGGAWIPDNDLRVKLWGARGAIEMERSALHKLVHDTRQMFLSRGVDGWFVEKQAGRTRLRLPEGRIHVHEAL